MKKQFLKGLLIKITSAVSATVLVFSAFAADTQAAAYNKVYSETDTTSTEAVWPDVEVYLSLLKNIKPII